MSASYIAQLQDDMVKPEQLFYLKKDGNMSFTLIIKPEQQQEAADAVFRLMQINPLLPKGQVALAAIIRMAKMVDDIPELGDFLLEGDEEDENLNYPLSRMRDEIDLPEGDDK